MGFREGLREEMKYQDLSAKEFAESTVISKQTIYNYLKTYS